MSKFRNKKKLFKKLKIRVINNNINNMKKINKRDLWQIYKIMSYEFIQVLIYHIDF